MKFTQHTPTTAPTASLPLIEKSKAAYGFLPNLHAVMAESPALYEAYLNVFDLVSQTSLTPIEQQVVMMTANYENNCHYCVPGHTYLMGAIGAPKDVIEALREGTPIADARLETLRRFTREMIENRGHVSEAAIESMDRAGYTRQQMLEVIVGLAAKTLSNYTNALAKTEVDAPVRPFAWVHPSQRVAV
ncbi:MAG: carboxymuconolactone decarboxylase family protein [Armatimonadetes bacterium]|nr:carboxymuconolactone decarboxylase family protein [Armatimonadota bacterium]